MNSHGKSNHLSLWFFAIFFIYSGQQFLTIWRLCCYSPNPAARSGTWRVFCQRVPFCTLNLESECADKIICLLVSTAKPENVLIRLIIWHALSMANLVGWFLTQVCIVLTRRFLYNLFIYLYACYLPCFFFYF